MADSNLVIYERTSPKCSARNHVIDRITIHCYVGQVTAKRGVDYLVETTRQASVNYVAGTDGIGQMIPENKRAWTSSSSANDGRAITIETACDATKPYAVREDVMARELDLVEDIMRRYGKNTLIWNPDKNAALAYEPKSNEMILTLHLWFAATSCPGDYLISKMDYIAKTITARLNGSAPINPEPTPTPVAPKSIDQLAQEVINGMWGNGSDRKNRLTAAGYDYAAVQARVNELVNVSSSKPQQKEEKPEPEPIEELTKETETLYRVQLGAYKDPNNAQKQLDKVKAAGFTDAFIAKVEIVKS